MSVSRTELAHSIAPAAVDAQLLELRAPWGLNGGYPDGGGLYLAVEGGCHVRLTGRELRLEQGDALFLPVGEPHALMDRPSSTTITVEEFCRSATRSGGAMIFDGAGAATRLLTIGFLFDLRRPWLDCLPPLHLRAGQHGALIRWLMASADLLRTPLPAPARLQVVRAVMAVVYALALEAPSSTPLSARDDRIVRAYAAMRRQPERTFTVDSLARIAGMSRSAFAAAFAACLGESPIRHLRRLRLERAEAMAATGVLQKAVAGAVGYAHGRSLARALRQHGRA
jgi:AraC-like DNA-binding protein